MNNFPDYVFSLTYKKVPLNELGPYLGIHKHLPNMPVADEIEKNGADLGKLQRLIIEKTEETFIY